MAQDRKVTDARVIDLVAKLATVPGIVGYQSIEDEGSAALVWPFK
jgi:hypothetical protein